MEQPATEEHHHANKKYRSNRIMGDHLIHSEFSRRRAGVRAAVMAAFAVVVARGMDAHAARQAQVAVGIRGLGAQAVERQVVAALPPGVALGDTAALDVELQRHQADIETALTHEDGPPPQFLRDLRRAQRAMGVDVVIVGMVVRVPNKHRARMLNVLIVPPFGDAASIRATIQMEKGMVPEEKIRQILSSTLEEVERATAAEPREVTEGDAEREEGTELSTRSAGRPSSVTEALMVGFAGIDFGGRQFHYNQRITNGNLRPYDLPQGALLPVTPGEALSIEVYPFARVRKAFIRDIGVTTRASYNFARAQLGDATFDTRWYAWEANLRGRLQLGTRGSSPLLGIEAGTGALAFAFAFRGNPAAADVLPNVDYRYVRAGFDVRQPVGAIAVTAGAGYRHLLTRARSSGESVPAAGRLGEHFPRASVAGLDARAGVALALGGHVEARWSVSYIRFWAAFHARPSDTYIAGGAVDQMIHTDLGLAVFF